MEEILCCIGAAIFSILAVVFGVKNRIHSSRPNTNRRVCDDGSRYNESLSRDKRLDQLEEQLREYSGRGDKTSERPEHISSRIRKREPEASVTK